MCFPDLQVQGASLTESPSCWLGDPWPCWQPHHPLPISCSSQRLGVARTLGQVHSWGTGTRWWWTLAQGYPHPRGLADSFFNLLSIFYPSPFFAASAVPGWVSFYPRRWPPHKALACFTLSVAGSSGTRMNTNWLKKKKYRFSRQRTMSLLGLHFGSKRVENKNIFN